MLRYKSAAISFVEVMDLIHHINTNIYMPEFIPAAPRPLTARPRMKEVDVGEAAVRIEPAIKTMKEST